MRNNYYEEKFDLKLLLLYLLKKWRQILIVILVGCLLGTLYSAYNATRKQQSSSIESVSIYNSSNVIQYVNLVKTFQKNTKQYNNSILMNLDPSNVHSAKLEYVISGLLQNQVIAQRQLSGILERNDNLKNIASKFNDIELDQFRQLVFIDKLQDLEEIELSLTLPVEYYADSIVVYIYGQDEHFVKTIADDVSALINTEINKLTKNYPDLVITKTVDDYAYGYNQYLMDLQNEKLVDFQKFLTNANNLKTKFTSAENDAFSRCYVNVNKTKQKMSLKWPLMFGAMFGIMMVCLYFVIYIFDDHIKSPQEIIDKYALNILGVVKQDKKEDIASKLSKYIDESQDNSIAYIKSLLKQINKKKILICSEYEDFNKSLGKLSAKYHVRGRLDNDEKAIEDIGSYDGIILVGKVWDTTNTQLKRQIDIAENFNKKIIGVITIL